MDAVTPATDGVNFYMRTSTNNGSSYDSGASDYKYNIARSNTSTATVSGVNDTADAQIVLNSSALGSDTNEDLVGVVEIMNPSNTKFTRVTSLINFETSANHIERCHTIGERSSAADVDAIQFLFSSGNVESGTFKLYGLKAS